MLYSIPGALIGETVTVRVDSHLVKVPFRGQVVDIHPKQPTDPPTKRITARRTERRCEGDLDNLQRMATGHGQAIGTYAGLLDIPCRTPCNL